MNPLLFAIIAMLCYGIGGPVQKAAIQNGTTVYGISLAYGTASILFALFGFKYGFFTETKGTVLSFVFGLMCGLALLAVSFAFSDPTSNVAIIATIIGIFPVVSSVIYFTQNGGANTNYYKFFIGLGLILLGLFLLFTSEKQTALT